MSTIKKTPQVSMRQIFWLKCINLVFRSTFFKESGLMEEMFSCRIFYLSSKLSGIFKLAVEYLSFSNIIL